MSGERDALPSIAETTANAVDSGRFAQYPEAEMTLRSGLARMYNGLGNLSESLRHSQRAVELKRQLLGADHEDTLQDGALAPSRSAPPCGRRQIGPHPLAATAYRRNPR